MTMQVGCSPGTVYTGDEMRQGKCPVPGTKGTSDGGKKEHILCLVAASQALTNGMVCTMDGTFTVTVGSATGASASDAGKIVVAVCSITASASVYIWCQQYGLATVRTTGTNVVPNLRMTFAGTTGKLTTTVTSVSAQIDGLTLAVTASAGTGTAFLNYPEWGGTRAVLT